jgi:predicted nucleic acid-binding protein
MQRGHVVELSAQLALEAAQLGLAHHLPMADSVILATARQHNARLLTLDSDFAELSGVVWIPKKTKG